ncbi:MAG: hypothetical protein IPQ07_21235 [Myxococcales bacterium]|nr:hypothetical protein [Myxococcales bacterium]
MRNLSFSILMLAALAACGGPSGKDIAMAKQARYTGDKLVLFAATKAAVESKYKLAKSDELALGMQTAARWYTSDGLTAPGTDEDFRQVPDKAIRVVHVVRMLPDGDKWIIQDEPVLMRRVAGSPAPEKLDPKDPSVPGWATGQIDELQYEIYKALKQYEVKAPGGMAPAPAAPAPEAAPAAGSDAPAPAPAQ